MLLQTYNKPGLVNIGTGRDISISELAQLICEIVGFQGKIVFDNIKPEGTPRKLLSVDKLSNARWIAKIELKEGIASVYNNFISKDWY